MVNQTNTANTSKTLLRSSAHVIVRNEKGNRLRSLLVGMQFGILYMPGELWKVALWPFVQNIWLAGYYFFDNVFFVLRMSLTAICYGFGGYLEAAEDSMNIESDKKPF